MVMKYVKTGWPTNRRNCAGGALAYWNIKDSLTVYEGLVFYGSRLVIPNMLRQEVLSPKGSTSGPSESEQNIAKSSTLGVLARYSKKNRRKILILRTL